MSAGRPSTGRLVELVVAGHQHRAELGADQNGAHVGDRVREVDQLKVKGTELNLLAGGQLLQAAPSESLCSSSLERTIPIVSRPP